MSHDRGCFNCDADTMADKRECYKRIGERCVKRSLFRDRDTVEPPAPSPRALKFWSE